MDLLSQHEAFLRAIFDAPDDDTPRLVYADFLQENGEDDRAELIRVQCELAHPPPSEADAQHADRRFHLFTRQAVLRTKLGWDDRWDRGFLGGDRRASVSGAELADPVALRWKIVTARPHWFGATALAVRARPPLDASRIDVLLTLPAFTRVAALDLRGDESVEAEHGDGILSVYVLHPTIGVTGLTALVAHKGMRRVTELDLTNNDLDNDAARALVRSPYLDNLKRLDLLHGNRFRGKVWQQVIARFGDAVGGQGDESIPF